MPEGTPNPKKPPLSPYLRLVFANLQKSKWQDHVKTLAPKEAEEFRVFVRASSFKAMEEMGMVEGVTPAFLDDIRAHYARPLGQN